MDSLHPLPSRGRLSLAFREVFCSQEAILSNLGGKGTEKEAWELVTFRVIGHWDPVWDDAQSLPSLFSSQHRTFLQAKSPFRLS